MSSLNIAPAPWVVDPDDREHMDWNKHILSADGNRVCFMAHSGTNDDTPLNNSAHLIASAPELYEALEIMLMHFSSNIGPRKLRAREMARAALSKARGEAS